MERTVLFGEGVARRLFEVPVLIRTNTVRIFLKMAAGGAGLSSPTSAFQSFSNLNIETLKKKISVCSLVMNISFGINWVTLSLKI